MVHPLSLSAIALVILILAVAWWRKLPIVLSLVLANLLVFILVAAGASFVDGYSAGQSLDDLAVKVSYFSDGHWEKSYTILTAAFMHASVGHLVGNMLVLVLMGLAFEERVGRGRFLWIYLASAVIAVVLHGAWVYTRPESSSQVDLPMVGASGAVFGIMGAFAIMYPRDQVIMPVGFFFMRVPVWIGTVIALLIQGISLYGYSGGGVAYAAHIGGAAGGVFLGLLVRVPGSARARAKPAARLDYAALERLSRTPKQQTLLHHVRSNEDQLDVQRAWLQKLFTTFECQECGSAMRAQGGGILMCERGHQERYVA